MKSRTGASRAFLAAGLAALAVVSSSRASTAPAWTLDDGLTSFDLHLLGLRARPEPEMQVVPRNTPTGLHVKLEFGSSTADVDQMLASVVAQAAALREEILEDVPTSQRECFLSHPDFRRPEEV